MDVIGVYTNPDLEQIKQYISDNKFTFIKWQDPKGTMLKRFFLPVDLEGQFMVPVTVLLKKSPPEIVASWSPKHAYTVEQVIIDLEKDVPQE
jgi:hypothetical protein